MFASSNMKQKPNYATIGVQQLQDIDEVNMFKDDNTVVHFKRPMSKPSN